MVQYRGQILPLVRLASYLGAGGGGGDGEQLQVVVYAERQRSVGLVVDRILDIVADAGDDLVRSDLDDHGVTGSAVIQERITEMLDVQQAIQAADPHFFLTEDAALQEAGV